MSTHSLDDQKRLRDLDKDDMLSHIVGLPDQFSDAWKRAKTVALPAPYIRFSNIVLLGMGGSAIGASLATALVANTAPVPVTVIRDYTLPQFVGRDSLVIAVSYSGTTEETVTAFREASRRGAKLIAISTGGELETIVSRVKSPLFRVEHESLPRGALGHLFLPILAVFAKLGLYPLEENGITRTVTRMREEVSRFHPDVSFEKNLAKKLAQEIHGKTVILLATSRLAEAARRWKTQMGENAKSAAFLDHFPELCHNTIVGFEYPKEQRKTLHYLLFPSAFDHPRNLLRIRYVASILKRKGLPHSVIETSDPQSELTELALLILLGDFVSFYLAVLNGVDPSPIPQIVELKEHLAKQT